MLILPELVAVAASAAGSGGVEEEDDDEYDGIRTSGGGEAQSRGGLEMRGANDERVHGLGR